MRVLSRGFTNTHPPIRISLGANKNTVRNTPLLAVIRCRESPSAFTSGSAPFAGSFQPEGLLSDFDGEDPNGTWMLEVTDDAGGDTGTLNSWSITLTYGSEPSTQTDAIGEYGFTGLPSPATYVVREVLLPGWEQTAPPSGSYTVTLAAGQNVTGRDFGNRLIPQAQMVLGGFYSVRGYEQSLMAADSVALARAEYRYHLPMALKIRQEPLELPFCRKIS